MRRLTAALFTVCLLPITTRCTEPAAPEPLPILATIKVELPASPLRVGQTTIASARGFDQHGEPISLGPIVWTATTQIAIDQNGQITAISPGPATVTASLGQKSGQAVLTVLALPATALALSTTPSSSAANRSVLAQQPAVKLVNASGGSVGQPGIVVTATASLGEIIGTSSAITDANGIATFTSLALAGTVGTRTVTFSAPDLSATSAAILLSAGSPASIVATAGNQQTAEAGAPVDVAPSVLIADIDGNPVSNAPVYFDVTSGNGTVNGSPATTNANGIATLGNWRLGAPGMNSLQAHALNATSGVAFSALATQAPALATITVSVTPTTIQIDQTAQATAAGIDQFGREIATGPVTWATNSASATVSASGVVRGALPGQAAITATAGGKTGQALISVTTAPVARVLTVLEIVLAPSAIMVGETSQATAVGRDQFGDPIAIGPITWTASGAATSASNGLITGRSAGTAQITATTDGVSSSAVLTVASIGAAPVLSSMSISTPGTTAMVGATLQATVRGRDQTGADFPTGMVVWSASGSAATVSQTGLISGVSAGLSEIRATALNGVFTYVTISITPLPPPPPVAPTLTILVVTLSANTVVTGESAQASVQGFDQYGASIATGPVTYFLSPSYSPYVLVSSSGLVTTTGDVGGTWMVVASAGGKTAQAALKIRASARVTATVAKSTLVIGETTTATVTIFDQDDAPILIPYSFNFNCPGGCSGNATVTKTSSTTFNITATASGTVILQARTSGGVGGSFHFATTGVTIVPPP